MVPRGAGDEPPALRAEPMADGAGKHQRVCGSCRRVALAGGWLWTPAPPPSRGRLCEPTAGGPLGGVARDGVRWPGVIVG